MNDVLLELFPSSKVGDTVSIADICILELNMKLRAVIWLLEHRQICSRPIMRLLKPWDHGCTLWDVHHHIRAVDKIGRDSTGISLACNPSQLFQILLKIYTVWAGIAQPDSQISSQASYHSSATREGLESRSRSIVAIDLGGGPLFHYCSLLVAECCRYVFNVYSWFENQKCLLVFSNNFLVVICRCLENDDF